MRCHVSSIRTVSNTVTTAVQCKFIYSSTYVSDVLDLIVRWKLINFVFQIFPLFILEMSTLFRLSPFISLGSCNHCNLACFI
jgi:hypothetical protein